jgi:coenzyme PQQ synthesis protein D (PqqD)
MEPMRIKGEISRVVTEYGDVILDERSGHYWHANRTAAIVLDAIAQDGNCEQAVQRLVFEFDLDRETAQVDVDTLVARLREIGVVT